MPSLRNRQTLDHLRSRSALPSSMTPRPVIADDFRCEGLVTRRSCGGRSTPAWVAVAAAAAEQGDYGTGPRRGTCRRLDAIAEFSPPWRTMASSTTPRDQTVHSAAHRVTAGQNLCLLSELTIVQETKSPHTRPSHKHFAVITANLCRMK